MSRDLSFWKYKEGIEMNDIEVYNKLSNGATIDGIEVLPKEDILNSIQDALVGWKQLDDMHYESGDELIEVNITSQFVRFDCYSVSEENMNLLIDVMGGYGCPLFDSGIGVRFEM